VLKVHKQSAKQTEDYAEKSVLNTATPTTWLLHRKRKKKTTRDQMKQQTPKKLRTAAPQHRKEPSSCISVAENNTYLVGQNHNRYLIALKKMTLTCTKAVELKGQPIYHPPISLSYNLATS
jgi:hypothetical protein